MILTSDFEQTRPGLNIAVLSLKQTHCFPPIGVLAIKRHFMFEKNQFFVIEMESPLEKDEYVTTLEFSGAYVDDMRGMYKASFEYKNGTES